MKHCASIFKFVNEHDEIEILFEVYGYSRDNFSYGKLLYKESEGYEVSYAKLNSTFSKVSIRLEKLNQGICDTYNIFVITARENLKRSELVQLGIDRKKIRSISSCYGYVESFLYHLLEQPELQVQVAPVSQINAAIELIRMWNDTFAALGNIKEQLKTLVEKRCEIISKIDKWIAEFSRQSYTALRNRPEFIEQLSV